MGHDGSTDEVTFEWDLIEFYEECGKSRSYTVHLIKWVPLLPLLLFVYLIQNLALA